MCTHVVDCSWHFSECDNLSSHQCSTLAAWGSWCQAGSTYHLRSLLRRTPASRIQKSFAARKAGLEKHARKTCCKFNNYNECISAVKGYTSGTSKFACFCYSGVIKKKSQTPFPDQKTHTQHAKTGIEPDWGWDHDTLVGAIKSLQSEAGPINSELIGSYLCHRVTGWTPHFHALPSAAVFIWW